MIKILIRNCVDFVFGRQRRVHWTFRKQQQFSLLKFRLDRFFSGKSEFKKANAPNAIFIVGCGHSGTSLLNKILGTHPQVYPIGGESNLFLPQRLSIPRVTETISKWLRAATNENASHFCEKTPRHIHKTAQIKSFFPEAKFIYITRNPLDCVASLYQRYNNLESALFRYEFDNFEGLSLVGTENFYWLKYESLITDFQGSLAKLLQFLELPKSDLSAFYDIQTNYDSPAISKPSSYDADSHSNMRNWQVNQPIFDTRGSYAKILTDADIKLCSKRLKHIAQILDYDL